MPRPTPTIRSCGLESGRYCEICIETLPSLDDTNPAVPAEQPRSGTARNPLTRTTQETLVIFVVPANKEPLGGPLQANGPAVVSRSAGVETLRRRWAVG